MNMNNLAMNALLGRLKNSNPQAYNEFIQLKNSGKDPNTILNELLSSGRFSQQQVEQAQAMMNNQNQKPNYRRF